MKIFKDEFELTPAAIDDVPCIKVNGIVYNKIYIKKERARCYYSDEEQHLIKVTEYHIKIQYSILNFLGNELYEYSSLSTINTYS